MRNRFKAARDLIRIARELVNNEVFGDYSVTLDKNTRTITVYFHFDGKEEQKAWKSAVECWKNIKMRLSKDKTVVMDSLENNDHKSFSFTVVVKKQPKTASIRYFVADDELPLDDSGDDEGDGEALDLDMGSDDDGGDDGDSDEGGDEEPEEEDNPEDMKKYREIRELVINICDKSNAWSYRE